ncbi:MAG: hypothetical protein MHMPM18_000779 [Marteilia pararefringens]
MLISTPGDLDVKNGIIECPDSDLHLLSQLFDRLNNDEKTIEILLEIFNSQAISYQKRFQIILAFNKKLIVCRISNNDLIEQIINFLVKTSVDIPEKQLSFMRQIFSSIVVLLILHSNHEDIYKTISNSLLIGKVEFSHMHWLILSYSYLETLSRSQEYLKIGKERRENLEKYYLNSCGEFMNKTIELLETSMDPQYVNNILRYITSVLSLRLFEFRHIAHFRLLNPIINTLKRPWQNEEIYYNIRYIMKMVGSLSSSISIFKNVKPTFQAMNELKTLEIDNNTRDHIAIGLLNFSFYIGKFICNQLFLHTDRDTIGNHFDLISNYLNTSNIEVYKEYLYFCEELSNYHIQHDKLECFCRTFLLSSLDNLLNVLAWDTSDQNNPNISKEKLRKLTVDLFQCISSIVTPKLILDSAIKKLSDPYMSREKIETYLFMLSCLHCPKDMKTSDTFYSILSGILSSYPSDQQEGKLSNKMITTYIQFMTTCIPVIDRENFKYLGVALEIVQSSLSKGINLNESTKLLRLICQIYPMRMAEFLGTIKEIYDVFVTKQFEPSKNILCGIVSLLQQCDSDTAKNAILYFSRSLVSHFQNCSLLEEKEKYNQLLAIFFKRVLFLKICTKHENIAYELVKDIIIPHIGCLSAYPNHKDQFYECFVDLSKCAMRILPKIINANFLCALIESLYRAYEVTNYSGFFYVISVGMEHFEMDQQCKDIALQILQKVFTSASTISIDSMNPNFADDIFTTAKKFYCSYPDEFISYDLHILMLKFSYTVMRNFFEVHVIESCLSFVKSMYNVKGNGTKILQETNFHSLIHILNVSYGDVFTFLISNLIQSYIERTTNDFATLLNQLYLFNSNLFIQELEKQLNNDYRLQDGRNVTLKEDIGELMSTLEFTVDGMLTHRSACDLVYKISSSAQIVSQ